MPPSIEDVARYCGVSTATVSRVLNDLPNVRPTTRAKVEEAITALDYRVSETARSLVTSESRLILALVPDLSNSYYSGIVRGIETVAREHKYQVLISDTYGDQARERTYLDMLRQNRTDGVICLDPVTTQRLYLDEVKSFPWVACSEFLTDTAIPHVSIDHEQAAKDAVLYLLSKGHQEIGFVNGDEKYLYAQQRRAGYEAALESAGIPLRPELIQSVGGVGYPLGELAARRLLALETPPSAIFAVADTLAIGVIKALFRSGLKVPQDVAVIGFDDVPISQMFEPSLTTIAQPCHELGAQATKQLIRIINGQAPESCTLNHTLIIRDSA